MIRKIICPTDLSSTAQNATAYAAKLCQLTGATLELIHAEPVSTLEFALAGRRKTETLLTWSKELEQQAVELNKLFNISCTADIDTHNRRLPEILASYNDEGTLIVMGTNGADTSFQQFFGSNAYNVALAVSNGVLIIPEGVSFRSISKIALAWDYHLPEHSQKKINAIANDLSAKLLYVHISRHATLISEDVFRAKRSELEEKQDQENEIEFQRTTAEDIEQGLLEFMANDVADILAIPLKNGRLIRHIFGSIANPGQLPTCPVLITYLD